MRTAQRLRAASAGDADLLVAIEADAFGAASWGARGVADGLSDRLVNTLVAEDEQGRACGFIMWRRTGDEAEVLTVAVSPDQQRRGFGARLVSAVMAALRDEGARSLFLEVDAGKAGAIALYESLGFMRVGRRKRYYRSGADALVLRADL